ncbi:MAG: DUF86 domain-containing protein [Acidobacteria bacterium]|nr:DUF86 domain-containing protein [Acidobacteriota bacterium]
MKDDRVYLGHIRDAIQDIEQYGSVGRDAFMADRMRQDAVIRKLEVIGEAVKKLSDNTKHRRLEIPWKQIAGMRDRLSHDYFGVDLALVWVVVVARIADAQKGNRGAAGGQRARASRGRGRPELMWLTSPRRAR